MSTTIIIGAISSVVLVLGVAVCLPRALAELIRAWVPVINAIAELRDELSALRTRSRTGTPSEGICGQPVGRRPGDASGHRASVDPPASEPTNHAARASLAAARKRR
jgi:hypothetical protein